MAKKTYTPEEISAMAARCRELKESIIATRQAGNYEEALALCAEYADQVVVWHKAHYGKAMRKPDPAYLLRAL